MSLRFHYYEHFLILCDQGFQYFSSLPVLHYLQAVLFIKIWKIFINILYNKHSLKSGGTKNHFRRVKVPGIAPYWKAWVPTTSANKRCSWASLSSLSHNCLYYSTFSNKNVLPASLRVDSIFKLWTLTVIVQTKISTLTAILGFQGFKTPPYHFRVWQVKPVLTESWINQNLV
jgi:hypothetical protein